MKETEMTVLTYIAAALAAVWFAVCSFRLLQLVWVRGKDGEEVYAEDALKIYLAPLFKPFGWVLRKVLGKALDKTGNALDFVLTPKTKEKKA